MLPVAEAAAKGPGVAGLLLCGVFTILGALLFYWLIAASVCRGIELAQQRAKMRARKRAGVSLRKQFAEDWEERRKR
ncbi:hypothetical protein [Actinoplanes rectilineatus]|uniref:hypothetical protein n=1 Tax=Actinoplanes rectilineatus TaxID=113571 RepID=UPI0005F2823D|nr:hypothetical protein [Actinoplanes rectilineatus]